MCNACSTSSGFSWLTDETEWTLEEAGSIATSNLLTTVQFFAWSLAKPSKEVQDVAAKLGHNLTIPEISDRPAAIICDALLKFLAQPSNWQEQAVLNSVGALSSLVDLNSQVRTPVRSLKLRVLFNMRQPDFFS